MIVAGPNSVDLVANITRWTKGNIFTFMVITDREYLNDKIQDGCDVKVTNSYTPVSFTINTLLVTVEMLRELKPIPYEKIYVATRTDFSWNNKNKEEMMSSLYVGSFEDFIEEKFILLFPEYSVIPLPDMIELIKKGNVVS